MFVGKLVFAQLMDFLPLHTFRRCVARYPSSYRNKNFFTFGSVSVHGVRTTDVPRKSARHRGLFARENPNFIILAFAGMSRGAIWPTRRRSATGGFIAILRTLLLWKRGVYADDAFGVDLENTVYALDTTTIDLSLKAFHGRLFHDQSRCEDAHAD